jgi:hypothetical protein
MSNQILNHLECQFCYNSLSTIHQIIEVIGCHWLDKTTHICDHVEQLHGGKCISTLIQNHIEDKCRCIFETFDDPTEEELILIGDLHKVNNRFNVIHHQFPKEFLFKFYKHHKSYCSVITKEDRLIHDKINKLIFGVINLGDKHLLTNASGLMSDLRGVLISDVCDIIINYCAFVMCLTV